MRRTAALDMEQVIAAHRQWLEAVFAGWRTKDHNELARLGEHCGADLSAHREPQGH